ncbi:MAG: pyridoxal-phosphate dependent enzyme [Acidimicrobiales bacterium]
MKPDASFPLDLIRSRPHTMWRYAEALPFALDAQAPPRLTMGEGGTPLVPVVLAGRTVLAKLEFVSPTLSFKDRGAVVVVARALEEGARRLVADSSGNAGMAIAAYAARAGLACTVFVPAATSAPKLAAIRAHGAEVRSVPGTREDVAAAAAEEVEATGARYASHVYDPAFVQGTKTFAFELWEQLGAAPGSAPGTLVLPVGNGTLVLGALLGFAELRAAGVLERQPRVVAVQAAACAPLAQAFEQGSLEPAPVIPARTVAEGVAVAAPARGTEILAAVRSEGGTIVAVDDAVVEEAARLLARQGLYVEPTAALPAAAVLDGLVFDDATGPIVVPLAGAGLKSAG